MIRHILFWKYTDAVKAQHQEAEALKFLQNSVATMRGRIDGLLCIEIGLNLAGGDYDLIFYAELRDEQALQCFQQHPLRNTFPPENQLMNTNSSGVGISKYSP